MWLAKGQLHAHLSASAEPSRTTRDARSLETDPGPWLAVTGPVIIALTVFAVSWLSHISF